MTIELHEHRARPVTYDPKTGHGSWFLCTCLADFPTRDLLHAHQADALREALRAAAVPDLDEASRYEPAPSGDD